jgi:hypothetical protein
MAIDVCESGVVAGGALGESHANGKVAYATGRKSNQATWS